MAKIKPLEILEGFTEAAPVALVASLLVGSATGLISHWALNSKTFPEQIPIANKTDNAAWEKTEDFALLLTGFSTLALLTIPACGLIAERLLTKQVAECSISGDIKGKDKYIFYLESEVNYWIKSAHKWKEGQEQVRRELVFYHSRYQQLTGNQAEPLCLNCHYYSNEAFLPCAVHPELKEFDCLDYEERGNDKSL